MPNLDLWIVAALYLVIGCTWNSGTNLDVCVGCLCNLDDFK